MIPEVDTTALRAIVREERRRHAMASLESATFVDVHTVNRLRMDVFAAGIAEREDAEALFAVERRGLSCCAEWRDFFVGAIVDHAVNDGPPRPSLTVDDAEWLLRQADRTRTLSAFAVLTGVLERARSVPASFVAGVMVRAEHGWPGLAERTLAA